MEPACLFFLAPLHPKVSKLGSRFALRARGKLYLLLGLTGTLEEYYRPQFVFQDGDG